MLFLLVQDTLQPFSGIGHDQHHPEALQNDKHCDKLSGKAVRLANHMVNENGFGIGMPLALSILKGQGGDIDVDFGGRGEGTTFILKFFK